MNYKLFKVLFEECITNSEYYNSLPDTHIKIIPAINDKEAINKIRKATPFLNNYKIVHIEELEFYGYKIIVEKNSNN